tara:strand:+ start:640 stop:861 length:222 start_codon:yes stop_codon:yes gene_type:complete
MEELVDLIATDASSSDVSDKIKDALMAKAAARIDAFRPEIAADVFGGEVPEVDAEYEDEVVDEVDEQPTEEDE